MIQIHDDWHPLAPEIRAYARSGQFIDLQQGGAVFPGFQPTNGDGFNLIAPLATTLGRELVGVKQAFRLYDSEMQQPTYIHNDSAMGTHSAILYLDPNPAVGGTDFWEPRIANPDPFEPSHWAGIRYVPGAFNRLLCFSSEQWHSRFPRHLEPGQSRLLWVAFFNLK